MRFHLPATLVVLSAALLAQGAVAPFQLSQTNPLPSLSPGVIPATQVQQVCMVHLAGDPPNIYQCGLTVVGLVGYGAVGGSDLLYGTYDVVTDTFTPTSEAAGLNTAGTEFGLQIHSSGLLAAFDLLPGLPHLATRTAIGQPWVDAGVINGLPTQSYYDPSLADYHGQLYLLHVLGFDVAMTPITTSPPATAGASVVIINPAVAGNTVNSPTPILDANGQLIGVSHHDLAGSDDDHYMSLDLDPSTRSVLLIDTTTWINNGAFIGGRFFDAEYTAAAAYNIFSTDTYWCPGGRAQIGSTMSVDFYAPPTTGTAVLLSTLLINLNFLPAPVAIPGLPGVLGINPSGAKMLGFNLHNNINGTATTSFGIPNNPALHNVRIAAQAAVLDGLAGTITLANTCALTVE